MDRDFFPNDWRGVWHVVAPAAMAIGVLTLPDRWFWSEVGAVTGTFLIYEVVRRVNQIGDPRHAKRPPDAP